jgi:hypothetical protein
VRALSLVITLGLVHVGAAHAAERVALASFRTLGEHMTEPARGALRLSLTGGLAAAGFDVVPDEEMTLKLKSVPGLAGCETTTCLKRLGEIVHARAALKASIEMIGTSRYLTTLQLVDTESGRELARVDDTCEICTLSEANDAVSNAAAALKAKLEPPRAAPAPAPQPTAVVTAPSPPPPDRSTLAMRYAGFALLGVGAVGFIVGFAELGVDHSRACTPPPGFVDCPQRVDTSVGQAFGFVTGALGVSSGAVLTYFGYRKPRTLSLAPSLGPRSAGATLHLAF